MNTPFYSLGLFCFLFITCTNSSTTQNKSDSLGVPKLANTNPNDLHNSNNSLDWVGVYEVNLNCKSCHQQNTILVLRPDDTYVLKNKTMHQQGEIIWSQNGETILLSRNGQKFKVGENKLYAINDSTKAMYNVANGQAVFYKKLDNTKIQIDTNTNHQQVADRIKAYLQKKYQQELKINLLQKEDRRFTFYALDLNGDHTNEYFVELNGQYHCGSGGCAYDLLNHDFSLHTEFVVSRPPFFKSTKKTNGWNNLIMYGKQQLHSKSSYYIHLQYDAKTRSYPSNPSLIKQSAVAPEKNDRVMWNDDCHYPQSFSF